MKQKNDNYQIVLYKNNVYYRSSSESYWWTHTIGNKLVTDKALMDKINKAADKKYSPAINLLKGIYEDDKAKGILKAQHRVTLKNLLIN